MNVPACPTCGSVLLTRHCNKPNDNCDLLRCANCKGYGNHKRWVAPTSRQGRDEWRAEKFD